MIPVKDTGKVLRHARLARYMRARREIYLNRPPELEHLSFQKWLHPHERIAAVKGTVVNG